MAFSHFNAREPISSRNKYMMRERAALIYSKNEQKCSSIVVGVKIQGFLKWKILSILNYVNILKFLWKKP